MNVSQTEAVMRVLHAHLGKSTYHKKDGEKSFHCPFCNHEKKKLQVNIQTQKWHCWVCNSRGQTINSLLRKSNAPTHVFPLIKEVYGDNHTINQKASTKTIYSLPQDYRPLYKPTNTPHYKNALHYATSIRGLSPIDIVKYEVGYCESGPYSGMLIVPSYDENGSLNYYVGRSFYEIDIKHKNPPISKDVIGFESHINWQEPVVLVEGAFDAITTKRNVIPLFGKRIHPTLRYRILQERVPKLYLALDPDAYKDSLEEIEYFLNNSIEVYYVELGNKDPNETKYKGMVLAIENAKQITFFDLIRYKINL